MANDTTSSNVYSIRVSFNQGLRSREIIVPYIIFDVLNQYLEHKFGHVSDVQITAYYFRLLD